jgi:hypothetical protein
MISGFGIVHSYDADEISKGAADTVKRVRVGYHMGRNFAGTKTILRSARKLGAPKDDPDVVTNHVFMAENRGRLKSNGLRSARVGAHVGEHQGKYLAGGAAAAVGGAAVGGHAVGRRKRA